MRSSVREKSIQRLMAKQQISATEPMSLPHPPYVLCQCMCLQHVPGEDHLSQLLFRHFGACCLVTVEMCLSCGLNINIWKKINSVLPASTVRRHSPKGTRLCKSSFCMTGRFGRIRSINALIFLPETSLREGRDVVWKHILATYVTVEQCGYLSVTLLHLDT